MYSDQENQRAKIDKVNVDYNSNKYRLRWTYPSENRKLSTLTMPNYPAEIERGIIITIEAMSWNCPQHIPLKYSEAEVNAKIKPLESKIARLEAKLAELTKSSSQSVM